MIAVEAVRHLALGCCLLCSAAGIVRIFWPENGFKPVINSVLVLYIIASALPMALQTDWAALGRELRGWARTETRNTTQKDFALYADALGRASAAAALQEQLAQNGIPARVEIGQEKCTVTLQSSSDLEAARPIVYAACGTLACEFRTADGGDIP